jgi:adenylosuccinate synthase
MPAISVFGAQWGDEGKGKIIDRMSREADMVVRYQGGANAGHTVVVGGEKFVLHLVPSGVLHPGKVNVIANGVAVDPLVLLQEIEELRGRGVAVGPHSLRLSGCAHVILDVHKRIDTLSERWRGAGRIGTTGRGIGPCYADKAARTGIRVVDWLDTERFRSRLAASLAEKNALLERVHGEAPIQIEETMDRHAAARAALAPFVADTGAEVRAAWRARKTILFEGAQGAMLDLDHGTYPFVTSSSTGTGGIASGVGFPPSWIDRVYGISKAYCTRVGEGPFPTEDTGPDGERIREVGQEYGATTGRPRRCGWFDAVAVRYALELNGATGWMMTNLDVLSAFDEIRVATAYDVPARGISKATDYPGCIAGLEEVVPSYETLPGWRDDLTAIRRYEHLPRHARDYVEGLERLVGFPVVLVSVGPERDQVIPRMAL